MDQERKNAEYQRVCDNLVKKIRIMVNAATDLQERRYALTTAEPLVRDFIISSNDYGLFDHWWDEPALRKEAKEFLKRPNDTTFSTIKLNTYGWDNGEEYELLFHYKTPAQHYYKSIMKNKMTYAANNGKLMYVKLTKNDLKDKEVVEFEQGVPQDEKLPFSREH